ncbi:hypothetical protein [Pedobacter panaciterrae]
MYHVFQQENEASVVLFTETCETEEELNELIDEPTLPIMFVYNDETQEVSHSSGYYDLDEIIQLISSRLKP